jgi:hypothetical protein
VGDDGQSTNRASFGERATRRRLQGDPFARDGNVRAAGPLEPEREPVPRQGAYRATFGDERAVRRHCRCSEEGRSQSKRAHRSHVGPRSRSTERCQGRARCVEGDFVDGTAAVLVGDRQRSAPVECPYRLGSTESRRRSDRSRSTRPCSPTRETPTSQDDSHRDIYWECDTGRRPVPFSNVTCHQRLLVGF